MGIKEILREVRGTHMNDVDRTGIAQTCVHCNASFSSAEFSAMSLVSIAEYSKCGDVPKW
jgi:hypothetical protein